MAGEFSRHAKDDDQLQRYQLLRRPLDLVVKLAVTDADELPVTPGRQRPAGLLTSRERQIVGARRRGNVQP